MRSGWTSQAVLGSHSETELPDEALQSIEADIVILDGKAHHTVEGALGYMSSFHASYGYYAEGVEKGTARLPDGWEGRIVTRKAGTVTGEEVLVHFPDVHDLCISKLVAGRVKDRQFVESLVDADLVDTGTLAERPSVTASTGTGWPCSPRNSGDDLPPSAQRG